jgi:hypothetical protein
MSKSTVHDFLLWKRGFERLEEFRRKEIRKSSIPRGAPALQDVLDSARFLGCKKPETGLGKLGLILAKIYK